MVTGQLENVKDAYVLQYYHTVSICYQNTKKKH